MDLARRAATPDDHTLARRIHHVAYRDVVERQFGRWDEAAQDAYFDRAWQEHDHDMLEWGGDACGYVAIEFGLESAHVHELVVHPEYQKRGIGTRVLLDTIDQARRTGLCVRLQVLLENSGAARLYERLGFRHCCTTATHQQMQFTP